jgi:hypothetical protein
MKKVSSLVAMSIFALTLAATPSLAGSPMNPGQWQVVTKTEMPGMPMAIPDVTNTYCLTEEDMIPRNEAPGQDCETLEYNVSGNKVTWRMVCEGGEGKTDMRGEITYQGNTFKGSAETTVNVPGQGQMTMTNKMTGKRIGDCTK